MNKEIHINVLHRYSYEYVWLFFHGARTNLDNIIYHHSENLHSKNQKEIVYKDENEEEPGRHPVPFDFSYKGIDFKTTFRIGAQHELRHKYHGMQYCINIFNLNIYYIQENLLDTQILPMGRFLKHINKVVIPKLNQLHEEGYNVAFMYNSWEPFTGYQKEYDSGATDTFNSFLLNLHPDIPVFTDSLVDNDILKETTGIEKKNRFDCYTQFANSIFWPSNSYYREYYYFHEWFKNMDRDKPKWKFHYAVRRWYGQKAEVAVELIKLKNPSIQVTMSDSFDKVEMLSISSISFREGKQDTYNTMVKYFEENPEFMLTKRGYNLDDWGGEWIEDNARELMWKILPQSNITILHEHEYHLSEKMMAHIILGKPFIPVYYISLDYLEKMFNSVGLTLPHPPFERYEHINDILDKLDNWTKDENWKPFRDSMYNWTMSLRKVLLEFMNKNNSMLNHIIKNQSMFEYQAVKK